MEARSRPVARPPLPEIPADPPDGRSPDRLDEALLHALARVEDNRMDFQIIACALGWDGHGVRSEEEIGEQFGLSRKGVRQIVDRAIERMRASDYVPGVVVEMIALTERLVPILEPELCEALLTARLCFVRFSCDGLVTAARVFKGKSPFEVATFGTTNSLIKAGAGEGIKHFAARAARLMQSHGCANVRELTEESRHIFGRFATNGFTQAVARTVARFEWLDREHGWFWYMPDRDYGENRLVNQIKRVLAVTPRIEIQELRSAIRRDHRMGSFAPPLHVLAAVCQRLLFVRLEGNVVTRVPALLAWDSVLGMAESAFVNVLQAHGPMLGRDEFRERCRERGMNETTFNQLAAHSAILSMPRPATYALVGSDIPTETSPDGVPATHDNKSMVIGHGVVPDAGIYVAWRVDASVLRSGILRVPEPVNTFVQGDYVLQTMTEQNLGSIQIHQRACWNVQRLLQFLGADLGEVLVIVLSLNGHRAIGMVGDESIVLRLAAGEFDLPKPVARASQGAGETAAVADERASAETRTGEDEPAVAATATGNATPDPPAT